MDWHRPSNIALEEVWQNSVQGQAAQMIKRGMNSFIGPALIGWASTLSIPVGVSLIVAGTLAITSGRLLEFAPEHKLWTFIVGFAFLCSLSTVPISESGTWSDTLFVAMFPVWAILIYFLPSVAANHSGQPNLNGILINLLFRLDDRWMDPSIVMDAPAVGKGQRPNLRKTPLGAVANNKAGRRPALNYSVRYGNFGYSRIESLMHPEIARPSSDTFLRVGLDRFPRVRNRLTTSRRKEAEF